jgi:hypothetical protein
MRLCRAYVGTCSYPTPRAGKKSTCMQGLVVYGGAQLVLIVAQLARPQRGAVPGAIPGSDDVMAAAAGDRMRVLEGAVAALYAEREIVPTQSPRHPDMQ